MTEKTKMKDVVSIYDFCPNWHKDLFLNQKNRKENYMTYKQKTGNQEIIIRRYNVMKRAFEDFNNALMLDHYSHDEEFVKDLIDKLYNFEMTSVKSIAYLRQFLPENDTILGSKC